MNPAVPTLVRSSHMLPKFQILGHTLRIHFNQTTEQVTDTSTEEVRTDHVSEEAVCTTYDNRSQMIEAIIKSRYRTIGAELAVINNGDELDYSEYQSFRQLAKTLANDWESYRTSHIEATP